MAEEIQQKPAQVAPVSGTAETDVTEKKSKWWIWLIIAIVIIGAGMLIWFLF